MSDRATPAVAGLYHNHIGECPDCRRMHRLLYALYEGPVVPNPPTGVRGEKEFHATLRRMRDETKSPWYHKLTIGAGFTVLAASAAILALSLFNISPSLDMGGPVADASTPQAALAAEPASGSLARDSGGIHHPAQISGRIVGGNATVLNNDGSAITSTAFPVGTRFSVDSGDTLQVGVIGKIIANFPSGSEVEWTTASRNLIELNLKQGIVAIRYDRLPSDPILQVRTPSAVVRVIGTVFTVQVDADNHTAVSVLRGQVDILRPDSNELLAEVEAGSVYNVNAASYTDVSKLEVKAALPLSNEAEAEAVSGATGDGAIPASWHVPGLSDDPGRRVLALVPGKATLADIDFDIDATPRTGTRTRKGHTPAAPSPVARALKDEGDDLIARLVEDAKATRKKELRENLALCDKLYRSQTKRYRAAGCLSNFLDEYGEDPAAVEAYLLVGVLRHDYGLDFRAAEKAFETFLRRAPNHPSAPYAHYRMWLSATKDGRISTAEKRGRLYLRKYPRGKHVGEIIQTFPKLKAEL